MMIIQLSADSNMDPSGSDMTVLSMAIGQMHCLVCNADLSVSGSWSSNIFDTKAKTHSRSLTLNKAMSDIIGEEISQNSIHSNTICQKCLQSVNEIDDLEDQLAALKKNFKTQYSETLEKVIKDNPSLSFLKDNNAGCSQVEFEVPAPKNFTKVKKGASEMFKCRECSKLFATNFLFAQHYRCHEKKLNFLDAYRKAFKTPHPKEEKPSPDSPSIIVCDTGLGEPVSEDEVDDDSSVSERVSTKSIMKSRKRKRKEPEVYRCMYCEKEYSVKLSYEAHIRSHTGERPFQCNHCFASFSQKSNLWSHVKAIHDKERKYKCDPCNKAFKRRRQLVQHTMSVHTGERPFQCHLCPAAFVNKEHFKKHQRTHTGEKPYSCKVCGKSFSSSGNLYIHRFVHTDKKPYECAYCNTGFMRKPQLLSHIQSHNVDTPESYIRCNNPDIESTTFNPVPEPEMYSEQPLVMNNCMQTITSSQAEKYEDATGSIILHDNTVASDVPGIYVSFQPSGVWSS